MVHAADGFVPGEIDVIIRLPADRDLVVGVEHDLPGDGLHELIVLGERVEDDLDGTGQRHIILVMLKTEVCVVAHEELLLGCDLELTVFLKTVEREGWALLGSKVYVLEVLTFRIVLDLAVLA